MTEPDFTPPVAAVRPHVVASPNGGRSDPYYWLRDDARENPEVLAYLRAENAYREQCMQAGKPFENALYQEIVSRLKQDDASVPYRKQGYWYITRFEAGREHPVYARRKGSLGAPEEVLLDANALAEGHEYYRIGSLEVSPDGAWLAFCEDSVGRREYALRVKDLRTGEILEIAIPGVESDLAWANDNRTILYVEKDPATLLGLYVKKYVLGTDPRHAALAFEQTDKSFYTGVSKSKSERFIFIHMESTVSSEWRYALADDPALEFRTFLPHERDHEYQLEHLGDNFIIRTNWQARNFRLMTVPIGKEGSRTDWSDVVAHREDTFIEDFDVFSGFLALSIRAGGLAKIGIVPSSLDPGPRGEFLIASDEAAYAMSLSVNAEIDTELLRYAYSSLTTPTTVYDYNVRTGEKILLKRDPVVGSFDPADYRTEFLFAPARDGLRIPVSLVYRKGFARDGSAPLLQYAYGAYGLSTDPGFSSARLSLIDRGFVYAIAHVRGGQEMGRAWYDAGRALHKMNSFTDFIDVTRHLVAQVDVVTTMLDDSIPLTTNEYDEWGDPNDRRDYDYMLAYSPYDNVRAQAYPAMFITTGLWDSQVQYYEPAKWIAKLRAVKTDSNHMFLHVDMAAGHGGKAGRFQRYREIAMEYAFLLDQAGIHP